MICSLLLLLEPLLDLVLSWLPLYTLGKTSLWMLLVIEGKLAVTLGRRLDSYLDLLDVDVPRLVGADKAAKAFVGPFITGLRSAKPLLQYTQTDKVQVQTLCKDYLATLDKLLPQQEAPKALPTTASLPVSIPPKKPRAKAKAFSWTVSVQLLMKKASKAEPALYFPHKVWFEPTTKLLYWEASGDDRCQSGRLVSVRQQSRASLTLLVELEGDSKLLRFSDSDTFDTWRTEVTKALG